MDESGNGTLLTRRRLILAAGAAGVAAIGGVAVSRAAPLGEWRQAVAGDDGAAASTAATVEFGQLASRTVRSPVRYVIVWPPGAAPGDPLPVCVALPARGDAPPLWFAEPLAEAVNEGRAAPFALAGVAGGASYWHPRADGEDRLAMLFDEFIPLCRERYGLGQRRRAIMGWSMGGYGALLAAETRSELFSAVVAVSPAVWTSYEEAQRRAPDAFDGPADFARHDVIAGAPRLAGAAVRVDCGTDDPFWPHVARLTAVLPEPAAGGFRKGGHGGAYWREVAPAEVEFVARTLAG